MISKPIELREADFKKQIEAFSGLYSKNMLNQFFDYWSEPSHGGRKMRFECEKTWHLGRRLARWDQNNFNKEQTKIVKVEEIKTPVTDIEKMDVELRRYKHHPTQFEFSDFGKWYDLLKENKLLKPYTKGQADELLNVYKGDKYKCRCAVVMQTFDEYAKTSVLFQEILELRNRLNAV